MHYNYLEQLPIALPLAIFSGVFQPRVTAGLCLSYIVGRQLYTSNYVNKGAEARYRGAPFIYSAVFGWLGITVWNAVKMTGVLGL